MSEPVYKAYQYRIYPDQAQKTLLAQTFGCVRFIYNEFLSQQTQRIKNDQKINSKNSCNNYCNRVLKDKHEWLRDVDKFALTNAIYNLDTAFQRYFDGISEYPVYKKKYISAKSYTTNFTNNNIAADFENNLVKLPKLGWVKAKLHRKFFGKIKSATVSESASGRYFVSILVEEEHEALPHTDKQIGLDLGLKQLATTSDGELFENLRVMRKYEAQLAKLQRQLAHKVYGSNNYFKQRRKVARCYERIAWVRRDYLHKLSHRIISENQVIVTESLQVINMAKNHCLSKSIMDVSWGEFLRQLEYKAAWNDRELIKVDRFFASSQLCSECGAKNPKVKDLSVREWDCPKCGARHDRDVNAAKNLLAEGLRLREQLLE